MNVLLREVIEKFGSEEIAYKVETGYYSDEAVIIAREVLATFGVVTSDEIEGLSQAKHVELTETKQRRKGKIISLLLLVPAPYAYLGLSSKLDSLIPCDPFAVYLIGVSIQVAVVLYSFYLLFKFSHKNLGVFHPIIFLVFLGRQRSSWV